jgi:simple sugar transport system permease protein
LRAVGEHPEAARSLGVDAARVRWQALLLAGALAGLGGAWLAADQRQFVAGMSNGRGYIALAAMIFGHWRPARAAAACLLFGLAEALQIALQAAGVGVPGWAVQMLPYALTMVTLAGFIGRATPPAALGRPEDR